MFFSRQSKVSRPIKALVGFGVVASCFTSSANAATSFRLAYDDGINTINGVLLADNLGGGQFHAIGGSVQVTGPSAGVWSLYAAGPQVTNIDNGALFVNNILRPFVNTATDPIVDEFGLVFAQGNGLLNFYVDVPPAYSLIDYDTITGQYGSQSLNLPYTISLTPVPGPLPLLGLGQALLLSRRLKKRRRASADLVSPTS